MPELLNGIAKRVRAESELEEVPALAEELIDDEAP